MKKIMILLTILLFMVSCAQKTDTNDDLNPKELSADVLEWVLPEPIWVGDYLITLRPVFVNLNESFAYLTDTYGEKIAQFKDSRELPEFSLDTIFDYYEAIEHPPVASYQQEIVRFVDIYENYAENEECARHITDYQNAYDSADAGGQIAALEFIQLCAYAIYEVDENGNTIGENLVP